jgi:hypothetical protein
VLCLARLLLPEEVSLDVPGLGTLALRFACLDGASTSGLLEDAATSCEAFPLGRAGRGSGLATGQAAAQSSPVGAMAPALLLIERRLARHLVNALLARATPPVAGSLSRVEHGLLVGLLASLFAKLGLSPGLQISAPDLPEIPPDALCIEVSARLAGENGRAWLCATAGDLERFWKTSRFGAEPDPVPLRLELARTALPKAEALAASDGDVVVFEETPALSPSSSSSSSSPSSPSSSSSYWPLEICYGTRRLQARLTPEGGVRLDARSIAAVRTGRAGAEWVEIAAEMLRPDAAETNRSTTDAVLSLRSDRSLLRMGDADWAEGRLCAVEGRLAVRITRLFVGRG